MECKVGDEEGPVYRDLYKLEDGKLIICGDAKRPKDFDEENTIEFRKE